MPMTPLVEIRSATRADVPLIRTLILELAEYERLTHEAVVTDVQIELALFGPRPAAEALIASVGETPAGFALFFQNYSTFTGTPGLYLEDLFVRPEHRGAGIGRALLARLAGIAVERGYARMEWAVLDWNTPAIGFYDRLGARPMADWTVYRLSGDALRKVARPSV